MIHKYRNVSLKKLNIIEEKVHVAKSTPSPPKGAKTENFRKIVKNRAFGGAYQPNGSPEADNA